MLKKAILLFCVLCGQKALVAQIDAAQVKAAVENEAKIYRQKLLKNSDNTATFIEFSVDTFKIEHTLEKMVASGNTAEMNQAISAALKEYDKILNKYYNKLLLKLQQQDKATLIKAQRAWLAYRDAELALISTLRQEKYSGGGTMQSTISVGLNLELVKSRTIEIYNHFAEIM